MHSVCKSMAQSQPSSLSLAAHSRDKLGTIRFLAPPPRIQLTTITTITTIIPADDAVNTVRHPSRTVALSLSTLASTRSLVGLRSFTTIDALTGKDFLPERYNVIFNFYHGSGRQRQRPIRTPHKAVRPITIFDLPVTPRRTDNSTHTRPNTRSLSLPIPSP